MKRWSKVVQAVRERAARVRQTAATFGEDPNVRAALSQALGFFKAELSTHYRKVWTWIRRYPLPAGALAIALLAIIAFRIWQTQLASQEQGPLVPRVHTLKLNSETLVQTVDSPASITYLEKAAVSARISGRIARLHAEQGQSVRRGEALAQLETFELELQLRQARARLNSALAQAGVSRARYGASRREADRQIRDLERSQAEIVDARASFLNARRQLQQRQQIFALGGASREEVKGAYTQYLAAMSRYYQTRKTYEMRIVGYRDQDLRQASWTIPEESQEKREAFISFNTETERQDLRAAQAAVQNAQLETESVQMLLQEATIRSPIDGVVAERALDLGEQTKEGEPLFVVVRMDRLQALMHATEDQAPLVHPGQKAHCSIDAYQGTEIEANVRLVAPVIDPASRSAEIRLEIDNGNRRLQPGMFARCRAEVRSIENALAAPLSALTEIRNGPDGRRAIAYVIQNNLVFRREIRLGEDFGERVQILEGLKAGELIALDSVDFLEDGLRIERIENEAANPISESSP
ncbi:MAG: efflux RND transporter periplasmic adaptor subunit [Leptospirales bacterium]|nr:efflux RND transporter periplasmic adaptor subunit [Leptospirales bacterium]